MKRYLITLLAMLSLLMLASVAMAQDFGPGQGNGVCQFIDENGDGFNDLAPDDDGDGIPNGMDDDYVRPEDGSGNMYRHMYRYIYRNLNGTGLVEGIGAMMGPFGNGENRGNGYGPGDGSGSGVGPGDGTGFGPGSGDCTGGEETAKLESRGRRGGRK